MTSLQDLANAREEILKAEMAALLHNLGKMSSAFVGQMTSFPSGYTDFSYQYITGILAEWYENHSSSLSSQDSDRIRDAANKAKSPVTYNFLDQIIHSKNIRQWFQELQIQLPSPLNDRKYAFGDLIEFHRGWHRRIPHRISIIYGFTPLLTNIIHISHDAASGGEKQHDNQNPQQQEGDKLTRASAFGYENQIDLLDLDKKRDQLLESVLFAFPDYQHTVRNALRNALGDTQRPINDVTLWDLSFSTATLLKSSVAVAILTGTGYQPSSEWRLLHVSFDGLAFWSHAHHVTDMLARREALRKGLDAVRNLIEVEYPLGNEVYRDEHGSIFVVADHDNLLSLTDNQGTPLKTLLQKAFDQEGIRGELLPEIEVSDPYQGKEINLAEALKNRYRTAQSDTQQLTHWWDESLRPDNAPICTVCGVRPVGYPRVNNGGTPDFESWATQKKATERNICRECLQRRGRRAKDWIDNKDHSFERTVWIDEVADINGRVALVVGRFVLDDWLNGKLIATLLKSASFARIQRCWETTQTFWEEVQQDTIPGTLQDSKQLRLKIHPANATDLKKLLGEYHTYELVVRGLRMGVCWDPDKEVFWTTANLRYYAKLLGRERRLWQQDDQLFALFKQEILNGTLSIYEPGGYLGQERKITQAAQDCLATGESRFTPFIPLVTEPAMFLALVPADKALGVVQKIKEKYDNEMARVHDRLPLHLGIVFASRRTPMQAILNAGRRMLEIPSKWEAWNVCPYPHRHIHFERHDRTFDWNYPEYMGDGKTEDIWYSHLLTTDPTQVSELGQQTHCVSVDDLQPGQTVYIRPSRFDFEFLDTTTRRFEMSYDENGRRRGRPTRPFLLDNLDNRLDTIWCRMKLLKPSQRHQVIQTIEATREHWFGEDFKEESQHDETFKQFVNDTLAGAEWPKTAPWKNVPARCQELLIQAGVRGELADLLELYHSILKEEE